MPLDDGEQHDRGGDARDGGDDLQEPGCVFDKVLYFPHIRVPDNEWFTRALLYWDEVGTIVPHAPPDEVREILGEHTLRLMDAGLVSRVRAGDAREIPRFDEAFIELIEADPAIPTSNHPGCRERPSRCT